MRTAHANSEVVTYATRLGSVLLPFASVCAAANRALGSPQWCLDRSRPCARRSAGCRGSRPAHLGCCDSDMRKRNMARQRVAARTSWSSVKRALVSKIQTWWNRELLHLCVWKKRGCLNASLKRGHHLGSLNLFLILHTGSSRAVSKVNQRSTCTDWEDHAEI